MSKFEMNVIHKLSDGSGFFVADIDANAKPPANPVFWNPGNKAVQDHRNGRIDMEATNRERAKRGLPVPWTPEMGEIETRQRDIP